MEIRQCPLKFNCGWCRWRIRTDNGYECALVVIADNLMGAGEHHE